MRFSLFLMVGLLCCWGATPATAQPVNDLCGGALPIGCGDIVLGETVTATVDTPPTCITTSGTQGGVWYTFLGTGDQVTLNTCQPGTTFDTKLRVYTGDCASSTWTCVTGNDDITCTPVFRSQVQWLSTPGVVYYVLVHGFGAASGNFEMLVSCLTPGPEVCNDLLDNDLDGAVDCGDIDCAGDPICAAAGNDECGGALPVTEGTFSFDTNTATQSLPGQTCGIDAPDLWFEYTTSCTGQATIETTSFISGTSPNDTIVEVLDVCGGLVIDCDDDSSPNGFLSLLSFPTVAGTSYFVRLSGWNNGVGVGDVTISCISGALEICNDTIDNDLDGLIDCADSVDCGSEPVCDESINCADAIDNDIDGFTDCDDADCVASPACAAPSSDFCLGATPIIEGVGFAFDTTTATLSGPFSCGIDAPDVWFAYTSSCNGQATIETTSGPGNDTIIEVLDACGGNVIDCDDDSSPNGFLSLLSFPSVAGTTYLVRVSGWAGGVGPGTFDVSCINAGVEDCTDGIDNDLDGLTDCADAIDCGAQPQCIEAGNCGDAIDNDADGLTDCSDSVDCPLGIAPCIPPTNDDCATAVAIACGATVTGDTTLALGETLGTCGTTDGTGGGVWFVYAGNGDQVTLTTCNPLSNYDTKIRVYEGSCAAPVCVVGNDDAACTFSFLRSTVTFLTVPGVDYFILVHGFAAAEGIFELSVNCITPGAEVCNDAIDNDLDGFLDCLDPDCAGSALCIENCTDGLDNDTDGFIDCADNECACTASCAAPIPGDECCAALPISAGANAFDTTGMTTSADPFNAGQCAGTAFGANDIDIWLSFTASITGDAFYDTCDAASHDTDVTIYEGSDCLTKVQIACNGDGVGLAGCQIFYSAGQFPVVAGETYLIRIGGYSAAEFGPGTFTIFETCSGAVTNLVGTADCVAGNVALTWDPAGFSTYDIARDGLTIATGLPGSATSYNDLAVANGTYQYDVIGNCAGGGGATSSTTVTVSAYGGEQDLVVRGELATGLTDSVAALTAELTALGRTFVIWDGAISDYPCNSAPFEIIWQMNGTFPSYRCLNAADGTVLQTAHLAGAGVYTECGDQWGFCALGSSGAFETMDGVASAADGGDGFTGMDGSDSGLGLDLSANANIAYTQDQAGNDWTDQLVVAASEGSLSAAAQIWALDDALGAPYTTGIYGTGIAPAGNVISGSWEFGGYGGDKSALASDYVAALGGGSAGPQFRRGDTNIDGLLNIADAIYGLGALFPPAGSPPNVLQCVDSADANDDGSVNIADMITILGVLFPSGGGPTVLPPPFNVCGVDPTTGDPNGCANYPTCP